MCNNRLTTLFFYVAEMSYLAGSFRKGHSTGCQWNSGVFGHHCSTPPTPVYSDQHKCAQMPSLPSFSLVRWARTQTRVSCLAVLAFGKVRRGHGISLRLLIAYLPTAVRFIAAVVIDDIGFLRFIKFVWTFGSFRITCKDRRRKYKEIKTRLKCEMCNICSVSFIK